MCVFFKEKIMKNFQRNNYQMVLTLLSMFCTFASYFFFYRHTFASYFPDNGIIAGVPQ